MTVKDHADAYCRRHALYPSRIVGENRLRAGEQSPPDCYVPPTLPGK